MEFEIEEILFKDLNTLWKETQEYSGITEDYFYDYFVGKENGFALQVRRAKRYKKNFVLKNLSEKYRHNLLLTMKKARCPNIIYTQAGFSCFLGQECSIKVQFFVGRSVVKIPACA
ncbi:hypothetical protein KRR40_11390 [Niabella defluvii]|nr:hypothetical protein KRR40_11390 [Niabella sp. I65]